MLVGGSFRAFSRCHDLPGRQGVDTSLYGLGTRNGHPGLRALVPKPASHGGHGRLFRCQIALVERATDQPFPVIWKAALALDPTTLRGQQGGRLRGGTVVADKFE